MYVFCIFCLINKTKLSIIKDEEVIMYVCICNGITEEMLESAAKQGQSEREILSRLGIGNSCGICVIDALEKFNKKNQQKEHKKSGTKS